MEWVMALRVAGGLMLSIAYPLLIARVLARGIAGISTTSQTLHLIAFVLRYGGAVLDKSAADQHNGSSSDYTKLYLILASASVLIAIRYHHARQVQAATKQHIQGLIKESSIYIIPSLLLAYRINYASFSWSDSWASRPSTLNWMSIIMEYFSIQDLLGLTTHDTVEIAWAASVFLVAMADIPQYMAFYRHTRQNIDGFLMTIMAMMALSSMLYTFIWIARYINGESFNYIAFSGAMVQAFAFWMFFVLVITKANDFGSELPEDLEAQLEEYDTSRWGGKARDPFEVQWQPNAHEYADRYGTEETSDK